MSYQIIIKSSFTKDLRKLPNEIVEIAKDKIQQLAFDPFPFHSKKIKGHQYSYRLRLGNYRIIYLVNNSQKEIKIFFIGHRKDIYRKLINF